jgi:hypothetical protein
MVVVMPVVVVVPGLGWGREGEAGDRQGGQGNSRVCERHGLSSVKWGAS